VLHCDPLGEGGDPSLGPPALPRRLTPHTFTRSLPVLDIPMPALLHWSRCPPQISLCSVAAPFPYRPVFEPHIL